MTRQRIVVFIIVAFIAFASKGCQVVSNDNQNEKESILAEKELEISDLIDKVDEYAAIRGNSKKFEMS